MQVASRPLPAWPRLPLCFHAGSSCQGPHGEPRVGWYLGDGKIYRHARWEELCLVFMWGVFCVLSLCLNVFDVTIQGRVCTLCFMFGLLLASRGFAHYWCGGEQGLRTAGFRVLCASEGLVTRVLTVPRVSGFWVFLTYQEVGRVWRTVRFGVLCSCAVHMGFWLFLRVWCFAQPQGGECFEDSRVWVFCVSCAEAHVCCSSGVLGFNAG